MREAFVNIREGKITNPVTVKNLFTLPDGRYLAKVDNTKKRTSPQNNFYWGAVLPLVKAGLRDLGYMEIKTNEDAHEVLKSLFLKRTIKSEISGDEIPIMGSTAELTTQEFMEFIEEINIWTSSYMGVSLPSPNEQMELL